MRKSGIPQRKSGIPQPKQWNFALSMRKSALHCGIPQFQLRKKRILRCIKRKSPATENSDYFKNPTFIFAENKRIIIGNLQTNTYLVFRQYNGIFFDNLSPEQSSLTNRAILWLQSKLVFWVGFLWVHMSHGNRYFHPIQHRYKLPAWAARLLTNTFWMNLSLVPQWGFNSTVRSAVSKTRFRSTVEKNSTNYIWWNQKDHHWEPPN